MTTSQIIVLELKKLGNCPTAWSTRGVKIKIKTVSFKMCFIFKYFNHFSLRKANNHLHWNALLETPNSILVCLCTPNPLSIWLAMNTSPGYGAENYYTSGFSTNMLQKQVRDSILDIHVNQLVIWNAGKQTKIFSVQRQ